jgi:hypothetical protein
MIESLFLIEADAECLMALGQYAGEWQRNRAKSPLVLLPNPSGIDPAILRAAGFRRLQSQFNGYIAFSETDERFDALGTTMEII